MKWVRRLQERLAGLTDALNRFPLTSVFLLAAAVTNAYMISSDKVHSKLLATFLVGAVLSAVSQVAFERFYSKQTSRYMLMGLAVLLTLGYYLIIHPVSEFSMELQIRTFVTLFALLIAFIWVPVIKSSISFNKSFMISFKSLFNSLFFSGVIMAGISLILGATDLLIFSIDYTVYPHTANIVFVIFAPIYFLSLIPVFHSGEENDRKIVKSAQVPKFFEILLSYIITPLIAVFTVILIIYIVQNIGGEFWTDNLLEPMLVSYAITVILVYILVSEIDNKFTAFFRKVFPKILIPIVIFQIIASILTLTDTGITHTRYYVILFGFFAAIAGVLLSFFPVRKNGYIAAILIVFASVSIVPPVDAFTVSKNSQISTLEETLVENGMLENNKITPNGSISDEDKEKITNTVDYLTMMDYAKDLKYLPKEFNTYDDFRDTFGFEMYRDPVKFHTDQYTFVTMKEPGIYPITGHDFFVQIDINLNLEFNNENHVYEFSKEGQKYILAKDKKDDSVEIKIMNENRDDILVFNTDEILERFADYKGENFVTPDEATFVKENDQAKMTFYMQTLQIDREQGYTSVMLYTFVQIK